MTCIAGIAQHGTVWIGGDSAGVGGYSLVQRADQKVFRNGAYIMGFTSSFRMGQLLRYKFIPPKVPTRGDLMRFMVADFAEAVRACLNEGGFAKKKDEVEQGGTFLVGVRGQLFAVMSDYQVAKTRHGFDACGCGDEIALGSLWSTRLGLSAEHRIKTALEAAETFSAGVRRPFIILSGKGDAT